MIPNDTFVVRKINDYKYVVIEREKTFYEFYSSCEGVAKIEAQKATNRLNAIDFLTVGRLEIDKEFIKIMVELRDELSKAIVSATHSDLEGR